MRSQSRVYALNELPGSVPLYYAESRFFALCVPLTDPVELAPTVGVNKKLPFHYR